MTGPVPYLRRVHHALADQVRAGVNVGRAVNVRAWPFSGVQVPKIEVWPDEKEGYLAYHGTLGPNGISNLNLRLRIEISVADPESAFNLMTDLLSWDHPASVYSAVMSNRQLDSGSGPLVDDAVVLLAEWEADEDVVGQVAWVPVMILARKEQIEAAT